MQWLQLGLDLAELAVVPAARSRGALYLLARLQGLLFLLVLADDVECVVVEEEGGLVLAVLGGVGLENVRTLAVLAQVEQGAPQGERVRGGVGPFEVVVVEGLLLVRRPLREYLIGGVGEEHAVAVIYI